MNNFMVAQRFADARAEDTPLDDIFNYVLRPRMRLIKAKPNESNSSGRSIAALW